MVEAVRPKPGETIYDLACGTGGFLLAAHDYIEKNYSLDKDQKRFLKFKTFRGEDIVDGVVRLCAMNLHQHGVGGEETPIKSGDSLTSDPCDRYDLVITNPPFGRRAASASSMDLRPAAWRPSPIPARTSGPQHPTSSSTSCST